jgi:hypothetical protein
MPAQEIVDAIKRQVATGSREPFADILATALAVPPSKTAFRSLARQNPRQYVQTLKDLAELTGFATRHESIQIKHDARSMALELVNRVGRERATAILADFGLPSSLIPAQTAAEPLQGEIIEQPGSESGDTSDHTETHTDDTETND